MDDKRSERIEEKLDEISDRLAVIDVTLAKQHVVLDEHVRRTNLLEQQLAPIKSDIDGAKSIIKFMMILTGLAGAITGFKNWMMK
jgi:hypothetical protein